MTRRPTPRNFSLVDVDIAGRLSDASSDDTPAQRLGLSIRWHYRRAGLTRDETAAAMGVNRATISNWVNAKTTPTAVQVLALDAALGLRPGTILHDAGLIDLFLDPLPARSDVIRSYNQYKDRYFPPKPRDDDFDDLAFMHPTDPPGPRCGF